MLSITLDRSSTFPSRKILMSGVNSNGKDKKEASSEKGRQRNWPIRKVFSSPS